MKKALVFGNGRSLKDIDFTTIDRSIYDWIGCTMALRHFNDIDCHPDVYVNADRVVCQNPEVIQYVNDNKCKAYLLSETIRDHIFDNKNILTKVHFIEDCIRQNIGIFKMVKNYCSGSSAVLFALQYYDIIDIAGFDCDYVEFLPECERLPDGTLRIKKTPKYNPNYFVDDYQREGDIYNVPNGKTVHMKSWEELKIIKQFMNEMFPENFQKKIITNYNDKRSISEHIATRKLFHHPLFKKLERKQKLAFCIPTTSNTKNWKTLDETYLYQIGLPSMKNIKDQEIKIYLGYDDDDKLYSNIELPTRHNEFSLEWIPFSDCKGNPCKIWTELSAKAVEDGFEYYMCCGDDIKFDPRVEWVGKFIKTLKKNRNIGYTAGFSNNDQIPTQFLLHKTHLDIFGWVFPPQIKNYFCDDWMYEIYGKHGTWMKDYKHYNLGGQPRYNPENARNLCTMLVKRHKPILNRFINNLNQK